MLYKVLVTKPSFKYQQYAKVEFTLLHFDMVVLWNWGKSENLLQGRKYSLLVIQREDGKLRKETPMFFWAAVSWFEYQNIGLYTGKVKR